ncbi:MAG: FGGY-family carbohydrate kinase, partial [Candidatus Limnocylindrales bacterium]
VGTSALKLGVFGPDLEKRCETQRDYEPHLYDRGKADIDPEAWWRAMRDACAEVRGSLGEVDVISLSVTTPGLTPMAADGTALGPAILFLDGRSQAQTAAIRRIVGEARFLAETCNLPVSGGSSLSSILWIRDEQPRVWAEAVKFGHCNTYLVKRMTGRWAIDPSTVSISGLYNTARNDLSWNGSVLRLAGISQDRLPPLLQSYDPVGPVLPAVADELGLPRDCTVLCGGNDAVLAALSGGLTQPGDINIISGTCDIASVCTDAPVSSPDFNVRCHVMPGRWLTFFVLNTGGAALDWFHASFCRELSDGQFYDEYVPGVLEAFLADPGADRREAQLPRYVPYLGGSRYSLEPLTAGFAGLTLETTRDDLMLGLIRGNAAYLGAHLEKVGELVSTGRRVGISGGGARVRGMLEARRRWTGAFDYVYQDQSSMLGAAMLGQIYRSGRPPNHGQVIARKDKEAVS